MSLLRWAFYGGGGGLHNQSQQPLAGPRQQQGGQQRPRPPRATLDQVAEALQKLPAEIFATKAELEGMRVVELKVWMGLRGIAWSIKPQIWMRQQVSHPCAAPHK